MPFQSRHPLCKWHLHSRSVSCRRDKDAANGLANDSHHRRPNLSSRNSNHLDCWFHPQLLQGRGSPACQKHFHSLQRCADAESGRTHYTSSEWYHCQQTSSLLLCTCSCLFCMVRFRPRKVLVLHNHHDRFHATHCKAVCCWLHLCNFWKTPHLPVSLRYLGH